MLRWCTTNEFFGYPPEEGSPETLDDFPFVPRGNLRRERKKTYFFHGNLHLDDQSRVALVLQLSVSQTLWFDASALSCLFGARWKENLFVGLVGFEMRPRFCAPFPNLQKFVGSRDSDSHNSAFLSCGCVVSSNILYHSNDSI